MLEFLKTEILVFLVLHWVDWRAHGNNCDYYYVGQDEKISNIPLSLSAVAIDTRDPSPSTRDIAHHCLWPSSRSNSCLITDVNMIDTFPCKDSSQDSRDPKRPHDILKYDQATPWTPSVSIVRLVRAIVQSIQASAPLTGVGEQCLTAAPTNAVRFPRYPSIAILNASPSRIRVIFPRYCTCDGLACRTRSFT
jgi:hypothetical protein